MANSAEKIVFNNATTASSTEMYVYETDDNSKSIDSFLTTISSITSNIKGFVRVAKNLIQIHLFFQITDISDNRSRYILDG